MADDRTAGAFYAEVGRRIRHARGDRTQAQLAKALDMTRSSIANLEAGRQRIPLHILVTAAEVLGVPVGSLLPELRSSQHPFLMMVDISDQPESTQAFIRGALAQASQGHETDPTPPPAG